jgi:hypothetical protein
MFWKLNFITTSIIEFEWEIENKNDLQKREHSTIKNGTLP